MNNDLISRKSLLKNIDEVIEQYSYEKDGAVSYWIGVAKMTNYVLIVASIMKSIMTIMNIALNVDRILMEERMMND